MIDLLSEKRVEELILDIERGQTCVLIKPRGVKVQVTSPPNFAITTRGRDINILDLISSDMYVVPYMHAHQYKFAFRDHEAYEIIYNYENRRIFLSSIKRFNEYINDYLVLQHRAGLFNLEMPIIDGLDMDSLISMIQAPGVYFEKLKLSEVATAVLFLNVDYQAMIMNPINERSQKASPAYNDLITAIVSTKPDSLSSDIRKRFIELFSWTKKAKKAIGNKLGSIIFPAHVTVVQPFTMTFLPPDLSNFISGSKGNAALFRTILFVIQGKGYNKELVAKADVERIRSMCDGLPWEI